MPRALIIERSATLRHSLQRRLLERAFECEVARQVDHALELIGERRDDFDLVVLGWPEHTPEAFSTLLQALAEHPTPLILLSDQLKQSRQQWAAKRANCALLSWSQVDRLHDLLDANSDADSPFGLSDSAAPDEAIEILLVDDSRTVRRRYSKLLQGHGYVVSTAEDVASGFAAACEGNFDLAIIDYFMPDNTGDVLCRQIKQDARTSRMLCSILTGSYSDNIIQDGLEAGAIEVMFKNEAEALFLTRVAAMRNTVIQRRGLEHRQRHLEGILNAVGEGVYGVDNAGQLTFMNPTARRLLGLEGAQLRGCEPRGLFHHAGRDGKALDAETCFLTGAYATGESLHQWENVFWSSDGTSIPVEGTILPLRIDDRRRGSVVAFRDVSEQEKLQNELLFQANHDTLTGLFNRGHFEQQVTQEIQRVQRTGDSSALLFIDLDRFKHVNDTAGHAAGDQLLQEVGNLLSSRLRGSDSLGRIGGDEFAILLRNVGLSDLTTAADAFRRLLVDYDFEHEGKTYLVAGSIGVTLIDTQGDSLEEVMARADHAARTAKEAGRNQTHIFQPEDDTRSETHQALGWSQRLSDALEHDRFALHQQTIVSCSHGGDETEVLLRLVENERIIRPSAFLPAAERFGLAEAIDCWVLENSLLTLAERGAQHRIWINLTASSLADEALGQQIIGWLSRYGVEGSQLGLELDEAAAIRQSEGLRKLADTLSPYGVVFGLDNFGASLGSFNRLRQLPVSQIKLDAELISALGTDDTQQAMLAASASIAKTMAVRTIVKGLETAAQADIAKRCKVDGLQGEFLHSATPWLAQADPQPSSASSSSA
jgi:diguanylate cyclase (GGDEF)-like protein/PAS domain S-box-containing protein